MKKLFLLTLLLVTILLSAEQGVVLHPQLSYRNVTNLEKWVDTHSYGSIVELTGETHVSGDTTYKEFILNDVKYASYFYYIINHSKPGVITKETFTFKYNDISAITPNKVNPLLFVAIDTATIGQPLVKVSYLVLNEKNEPVKITSVWVKSEDVSQDDDDIGTAKKYFNASISDDAEMVRRNLTLITRKHEKSVFIELISDMLNNTNLKVLQDKPNIDDNFIGTNSYLLQSFTGNIYNESNISSKVISTGVYKIKLLKKTINKVQDGEKFDYMYYVNTGSLQGWIHGLK